MIFYKVSEVMLLIITLINFTGFVNQIVFVGYDEETKDYREQLDFKDSESTRQTEGFCNDREKLVDLSYLVKLFF